MNEKQEKCYMCEENAVSKEHVPPLCLFPEEKDIKTSIFRNNLITVPSCELHNSKKSKDDEFLMISLAGIVGNNVLGYFHMQTKVKRALTRKGLKTLNIIMDQPKEEEINGVDGIKTQVIVGKPHFNRLDSCFKHIAFGLFYYKFGKRFEGECNIFMDFIDYNNNKHEKLKQLIRKRIEMEPNKLETEGSNPEVFRYEFFEPDEFGLIGLQMTFYEGAKVFIAFKRTDIKLPFNLAMELINSNIKTIVNFSDGTDIEFN